VPTPSASAQKKSVSKSLIWGIVGIFVIAICGVGYNAISKLGAQTTQESVTSTPNPTATINQIIQALETQKSEPTQRATATPNLAKTQQAVQQGLNAIATAKSADLLLSEGSKWDIKLSDTFDNKTNPYRWFTGNDVSEYGKGEAKITDGKYLWTYTSTQGVFYRSWVYTISLTDFYLAVDARETNECKTCEYGMVFRNSASNDYYYFGISPKNREYFFYIYYEDNWKALIDYTLSTTIISSGAPNKLTLIAQGSHFIFFINNQFVAEIIDSTLSNGPMGLGIGLEANEQGAFEFDNVELRTPPK